MVIVDAAMLAAVAVFRKQLLANEIGRRLTAMPLIWGGTNLVGRLIAARLDLPPAPVLVYEMWMSVGLFILGGLTVHRQAAWVALPFATGALLSLYRPEMAPVLYDVIALAASVVLLFVFRRSGPRARETGSEPGR